MSVSYLVYSRLEYNRILIPHVDFIFF